jgi:flagellar biosynthesis protein FliR
VYERRSDKLISRRAFAARMLRHGGYATALVAVSIAIGMLGYHFLDRLAWVDAFVDTSMLLGGMGPVNPLRGESAKVFAGIFALYAGLVFLALTAIMLAPVLHRVLHAFHAEAK